MAHGPIAQHFRPRRHLLSALAYREEMKNRFARWAKSRAQSKRCIRAELVGCQAEKCLLLLGDDISPNKLTMPPVAIECVRNIRREALASFWETCHVAKHHVTKPDHIWFFGLIEDEERKFKRPFPPTPSPSACQSRRRAIEQRETSQTAGQRRPNGGLGTEGRRVWRGGAGGDKLSGHWS
jgi:hypothetical protein